MAIQFQSDFIKLTQEADYNPFQIPYLNSDKYTDKGKSHDRWLSVFFISKMYCSEWLGGVSFNHLIFGYCF